MASAAIAPALAFSYDDVVAADARHVAFYDGTASPDTTSNPVSAGLALFTSLSATLAILSLLSALLVRGTLIFTEGLTKTAFARFRRFLYPVAVLAVAPLCVSLVTFVVCFYYAGWVAYPVSLVGNISWVISGLWLMVAATLLLLYGFCLGLYVHRQKRKAKGGAGPRPAVQITLEV